MRFRSDRTQNGTAYERNSRRISRIEDFCRNEDSKRQPGPLVENGVNWCRFNDCPIYWVPTYTFSFCFLHKVASTTFQGHLVKLNGFINLTKAETQWHGHRLRRFSPAHMMYPPFSNHAKFLFARHPFRRLVSAYFAKLVIECVDQERPKKGPLCTLGHRIKLHYRGEDKNRYEAATFKELVRYIVDGVEEFDSHWTLMSDICQPCTVHYDFVGKIETAAEDMAYIYGKLGLSDFLGEVDEVHNASGSEDKFYECFSQLTMEEFDNLVQVYEPDFTYFDYSPEEFRKYVGNRTSPARL